MNDDIKKEIDNLKKEICEKLDLIVNDYSHYRNKKIINIIDYLYTMLYDEKDFHKQLLEKFKKDLSLIELDNTTFKKINNKLLFYIANNEKEYIDKIVTKDWTIYIYIDYYMWYINNKKINIMKEYTKLFPNSEISSIKIDDRLRKKIENITNEDLIYAKNIKIRIKKKNIQNNNTSTNN